MKKYTALLLTAVALLLSSCMAMEPADKNGFDGSGDTAVTVSGTIIDAADNSPLAGIQVTMYSYDMQDTEASKSSASCTSDANGNYIVTIEHNFPGDFFRITATDPAGLYTSKGIEYISWDGKVNIFRSQNIVMNKK